MNIETLFSKNLLQQYCQKKKIGDPPHCPIYKSITEGPIHRRRFKAQVIVGDKVFENEEWRTTKKVAEIEAAAIALQHLDISETFNKSGTSLSSERAKEKVEFFFNNYDSLLKDLGLQSKVNSLDESQQKEFKKYLTTAFLHPSVARVSSCELMIAKELGTQEVSDYNVLECFGDAILYFLVTRHLYFNVKLKHESEISRTRSMLVCRKNLNSVFISSGLSKYIMCVCNRKLSDTSICGNVLEALIGAIYNMFGEEETEKLIKNKLHIY